VAERADTVVVEPLKLLKTLPDEFWLIAPTYDNIYSTGGYRPASPLVRTHENCKNGDLSKEDLSALDDKFPTWAAIRDQVIEREISVDWLYYHSYHPRHEKKPYLVWKIGDDRFRFAEEHGSKKVQVQTEDPAEEWQTVRRLDDWNESQRLEKVLAKIPALWNRLRLKARRKAAVEESAEEKKARVTAEKEQALQIAKADVLTYTYELIDLLTEYAGFVEADEVTPERASRVFEATNEMTSVNAKLKRALGF
jgi:hypothetical protein